MAGISSRAAGIIPNKDKTFQGQKFDDDLGINYDEFKWRNDDPQIGRFIEIDPLSEDYEYNSTYAFSENKVTTHVELEGLESRWYGILWNAVVETGKQLGTAAYGLVGGAVNTVSIGLVSSDPFNLGNNLSDPLLKNILQSSTDIGKIVPLIYTPEEAPVNESIPVRVETTPTTSRPTESPVTTPTKVESNSNSNNSSSASSSNKNTNQSNLKLSKVEKSTTTANIGNGKFTKTTEVKPGNGPGQSRAEYIKYKNEKGTTIKVVKDSYDRANSFQHRKIKLPTSN